MIRIAITPAAFEAVVSTLPLGSVGAARLMLAVTERLLIDEGLDWVFCDTDSMAFAAPAEISLNEFEARVRDVCAWFDSLNPYEQPGSILEFEDQNFALDGPLLAAAEGVITPGEIEQLKQRYSEEIRQRYAGR